MTYSQQGATKTRFDFDAVAAIYATMRQAERRKLRRLRAIKRLLHLLGFLCYWAIFVAIAYLCLLTAAIVFIRLS